MSTYTIQMENKTTLKGTLTDLIKMNLSKTDTPLKTSDSHDTEELLIPIFDEKMEIKEDIPVKNKEVLTIAQRRPVRQTRSKPLRYIDPSSDSDEDSMDSSEEELGSDEEGEMSESDSDTPPEERIDEPDSDDLDFIADDAGSSSDDDEKDFVPDSDTASTDSIPDSSSESSTDFNDDELLSDDLSL